MDTVKLRVTSKVLEQAEKVQNQQQIAISEPTGSLENEVLSCNKNSQIKIILSGSLELNLGDTSAIWRAHNKNSLAEFDNLFHFLSNKPDQEFEFICSVVNG